MAFETTTGGKKVSAYRATQQPSSSRHSPPEQYLEIANALELINPIGLNGILSQFESLHKRTAALAVLRSAIKSAYWDQSAAVDNTPKLLTALTRVQSRSEVYKTWVEEEHRVRSKYVECFEYVCRNYPDWDRVWNISMQMMSVVESRVQAEVQWMSQLEEYLALRATVLLGSSDISKKEKS